MKNIEERLQALEDRAEILDLIASYGPFADSGNGQAIERLWAEGGTYSFDTTTLQYEDLAGLVEFDTHKDFMAAGCAHVGTAPSLRIDGDTAVATNHSLVFARRGEPWTAERVSANRWELTRTAEGWKVSKRENRLLTGSEWARQLFSN